MTNDMDGLMSPMPCLTRVERQRVIQQFNNTAQPYPREKLLHQLFEEQVRKIPDAIAVVGADGRLTYAELNSRADRLARRLRSCGVGPEKLVAIFQSARST